MHPQTTPHPAPSGFIAGLYRGLFDTDHPHGYAQTLERLIALLIVASVCAVVLEHVPEVYEPNALYFHWFDIVTVGVFTLEYALRWIAAGADPAYAGRAWPRLRHTFSFYALIDLVAIAPFYFAQFVAVDVEMLRVLRMLRLMRMLKLSRQLIPAWQPAGSGKAGEGRRVASKGRPQTEGGKFLTKGVFHKNGKTKH